MNKAERAAMINRARAERGRDVIREYEHNRRGAMVGLTVEEIMVRILTDFRHYIHRQEDVEEEWNVDTQMASVSDADEEAKIRFKRQIDRERVAHMYQKGEE